MKAYSVESENFGTQYFTSRKERNRYDKDLTEEGGEETYVRTITDVCEHMETQDERIRELEGAIVALTYALTEFDIAVPQFITDVVKSAAPEALEDNQRNAKHHTHADDPWAFRVRSTQPGGSEDDPAS